MKGELQREGEGQSKGTLVHRELLVEGPERVQRSNWKRKEGVGRKEIEMKGKARVFVSKVAS